MLVVMAGTYMAILCWGMLLQCVHIFLSRLRPEAPFAFVAAILLIVLWLYVRRALRRRDVGNVRPGSPRQEDSSGES